MLQPAYPVPVCCPARKLAMSVPQWTWPTVGCPAANSTVWTSFTRCPCCVKTVPHTAQANCRMPRIRPIHLTPVFTHDPDLAKAFANLPSVYCIRQRHGTDHRHLGAVSGQLLHFGEAQAPGRIRNTGTAGKTGAGCTAAAGASHSEFAHPGQRY